MSCINTGYNLPCKSISGVSEVYIGVYNGPALSYTYDVNGAINSFTGSTVSFFKYEQRLEQASATEEFTFGENGGVSVTQKLDIVLEGYSTQTKNEIAILSKGRFRVIIKDQEGNYHLMGEKNPVSVTAGTGGLGKMTSDGRFITLSFEGKESELIKTVSSAAALSVIAD